MSCESDQKCGLLSGENEDYYSWHYCQEQDPTKISPAE